MSTCLKEDIRELGSPGEERPGMDIVNKHLPQEF